MKIKRKTCPTCHGTGLDLAQVLTVSWRSGRHPQPKCKSCGGEGAMPGREAKVRRLMPKSTADLLEAEFNYLVAGGWRLKSGLWWNPQYTVGFPQTYAVLVSKSTDHNVGLP